MFERSRLARSGRDPGAIKTARLAAGRTSTGRVVTEEVPVEPLDGPRAVLLATPGLVDGVAADDVIELLTAGAFAVEARGGNFGLRIYEREQDAPGIERLIDAAEVLGGWLDGLHPDRLVVLTFPLTTAFRDMEDLANEYAAPRGAEWHYTNVYDPHGAPLGWWEDRLDELQREVQALQALWTTEADEWVLVGERRDDLLPGHSASTQLMLIEDEQVRRAVVARMLEFGARVVDPGAFVS